MTDMPAKIREAALCILTEEGPQALSMRKLALRMGCTTGVLYHHYPHKEAILSSMAEEGYRKILEEIKNTPLDPDHPVEGIKEFFAGYIRRMLANRPYASVALMSPIAPILEKSAVLTRGVSQKSATFGILTGLVSAGIHKGLIRPGDPELTAQLVWTTCFGLLARLVLEKDVPEDQQHRLLEGLDQILERILRP